MPWLLLLLVPLVVFIAAVLRSAKQLERLCLSPSPVLQYSGLDTAPTISHRRFSLDDVSVDFSFVIPCYNESKRILSTLESTTTFLEGLTFDSDLSYELVIVDDGSTDATVEVVQTFFQHVKGDRDRFRVLKLERNCGKGVAVIEGLMRSRGALCLFMDADGATDITDFRTVHQTLMQLIQLHREQKMEKDVYKGVGGKLGVVVGSRAHLQSKTTAQRSIYRNILMHGFHFLVWLVTLTPIKDTQCGFKLFTRAAVHRIFPHVKIRRWCFDVEVLYLAKRNGIVVGEVPVKWREIEGSKVKFYHILHMAWELAIIFFGYKVFSTWKTWTTRKTD